MILVADSGSSKTDWRLAAGSGSPLSFSTVGLNPYFVTDKDIIKSIQDQARDMVSHSADVEEIYFFGAGCSSPDRREIVSNALSHIFPKAYISVDSDLLGSAYATCGKNRGFCCVLGTGSNISYFDGEAIHDGKHGLGYVLGDEGSGTWFGKSLITDYLYGNMPEDIRAEFESSFPITKEEVIRNVYMKSRANAYLASFAKFLTLIRYTDYGQQLLGKGLLEFVQGDIKSYPDYTQHIFHFVGSIAYCFSEELKEVCAQNGIAIGKIIRQPVNDLLEYILARNQEASLG